ncbi:pilus assembly protein [Nostoc sp. 'Peltigera membranacea cyanobiont' 210A]|uniref:type II toxin-antitoxin system VapC family toxin n=1 Tax=Nostoc sp. 'Peltigera membranacea cyanobiont' 210A TaxID=2014529 RepID=UPI000B953D35|nr:PIN domain-containing protein [Nostoc sp. 'Peltigera membranacea cyanobiont' 210A]OYD90228.1 pilus assembly protein [Nostoc sp. 'Peltigera membranacea cyanobiont' 210A]
MKQNIIIDTGPLVALINNQERYHSWATKEVANLAYPFFTCEAVISETCFILRDFYGGEDTVMSLLDTGLIQISFRLSDEIGTVRELLKRYQNVPMSLADACLVRMSELINGSSVLTLDSDFRVYRKNKNEMMDLIIADGI